MVVLPMPPLAPKTVMIAPCGPRMELSALRRWRRSSDSNVAERVRLSWSGRNGLSMKLRAPASIALRMMSRSAVSA